MQRPEGPFSQEMDAIHRYIMNTLFEACRAVYHFENQWIVDHPIIEMAILYKTYGKHRQRAVLASNMLFNSIPYLEKTFS